MTTSRLRVLCLHGYHGSAAILRQQLTWHDDLEDLADFVFVDAPSRADGDFGWWHARDGRYRGWERTRAAIEAVIARDGPFHGVLGFSQGAALAGVLVGLRLGFGFAIVVGGFSSNDGELAQLYDDRDAYAIPSLHVLGRADTIVPPDDSRRLASRFRAPTVVEHAGGHIIPRDALPDVRAFLQARS